MSRGRRARRWLRWTVRDARRRWLQVVSIGLLLALGVGMYSAMTSMSSWRVSSADASFAALRFHDLRVSLVAGSYTQQGKLQRALGLIPTRGSVTAADERLVIPAQVDASTDRESIIVPGRIVGQPLPASVDALSTERGRALGGAQDGQPVVELERHFAKEHGLPPTGTLRLGGGRVVRYAGQVLAPEYFVVTAPGADFGAEANFAVLFTSLRTAQELSGRPGQVNELILRVKPGTDVRALQTELSRALHTTVPGTGFTFTTGDQEPSHRLLYKDAEGDQQMMDIFAFLLLGAAAFAAFNLVSRTVEAQRREIGIGMALGVPPRQLAVRPFLVGAQVALIGVGLGVPAGLAANAWLGSVMESFFPLPVLRTPMNLSVFAQGAALGIIVSVVATAIPLRRALRVTPVEAIRVGARSAKSSGLAWLTRGLRLPGGSLANMPLRNVLRAPRRTIMTALGIGAVVAITLALAGIMDSFGTTLDAIRAEALTGSQQRLTVDLATPQRANAKLLRSIAGSSTVGAEQPSLRLAAKLANGSRQLDVFLELTSGGRLWQPTTSQGSLPPGRPGVLIAARAAEDLHLHVGDTVTVRYPVPTGPASYALAAVRLPISGIHTSPLRFIAYGNRSAANALGLGGLVNRLSVIPAPGHSAADVKRALLAIPSVTAVQGASAASDAVDKSVAQFTDILLITVVIAMTMALLMAYNSAAINAEERTREHATLFAYGIGPARVLRGSVVEALLTGVFATAVGVLAGYAILRLSIDVSMRDTMPDLGTLISISLPTFALAALAGIVSVALAPLLTFRRLRRTDIPSSLRVVE